MIQLGTIVVPGAGPAGPPGPAPAGAVDDVVYLSASGVAAARTTALQLAVAAASNRTALGLGTCATLNVGTAAGTVCAGNDSRIPTSGEKTTLGVLCTGGSITEVWTSAGGGLAAGWAALTGLPSGVRGDLLRHNGTTWVSFAANGANTFPGGDGVDVVERTAAQVRTSLGYAPTTAVGVAAAQAYLRGGPVCLYATNDSSYISSVTPPAAGAAPVIGLSTSFVFTYYCPTAGGYRNGHALSTADGGYTGGWAVTADGADLYFIFLGAGTTPYTFTGAAAVAGWHQVCASVQSDSRIWYTIDGAAVIKPATITAVNARSAATVWIGRGVNANVYSDLGLGFFGVLPGVLAEGDASTPGTLRGVAANPAVGYPDLTGLSPSWAWAAAQFAGAQRCTIGTVAYAVTGSPQIWVP